MKLLYLPLLNPSPDGASEQLDLMEAFRKKFELEVFDYMASERPEDDLREIFHRFVPDVCHGQYQENPDIGPQCLLELKREFPDTIFTQWGGDVRPRPMRQFVEIGKVIDFSMISNTGQIPMYEQEIGKRVYYWQNAVGPSFFVEPVAGEGIVFCGRNYHVVKDPSLSSFPLSPQRWEMVEHMRTYFPDRFRLYGDGWPSGWTVGRTMWRDQTDIYGQSFCTIGHNHLDHRHYFSDRNLICMAAGRPHVCHYTESLEDIFQDGKECLFWRTPAECVEKVRWLIDHPDEATEIGLRGQERVRLEHTWDVRVREYCQIVGIQ